jgi:uncharacterized protein (DUF58 family)
MAGLLAIALLALLLGLALRYDPLVYLFYVLVGIFLLNRLWLRRSRRALRGRRQLSISGGGRPAGGSDHSAFIGDRVTVTIEIVNQGRLPLAWAAVRERLPTALRPVEPASWTISLGPGARQRHQYTLVCARRGYYPIGPLTAAGGTPWEAERQEGVLAALIYFTVYPLIIPLDRLGLPSRLPLGARRSLNPLLPDPSRLSGIRDYQPGDRLRDVHWRATARTGHLQVKLYQPSQPLQVALFLDLDSHAYDFRTRERASELAIVVAASLAAHVVGERQAVGLYCNGRDPLEASSPATPPPAEAPPAAGTGRPVPPPMVPAVALPATDRLIASASLLPPPRPRRLLATDPFAPPALPEETYDEDASSYFDGPAVSGAPAAPLVVPVRDGRGHLATLLTLLARVSLREGVSEGNTTPGQVPLPFGRLVRRRSAGLPWGTTLILITAAASDELLPLMLQLRHQGYSPLVILVQSEQLTEGPTAATLRAAGLNAYAVYDEARLHELPLMPPARR